jgi:hypothetical protein
VRRIVGHMQTTLNNRIATADGVFWDPFPWGDEDMAYVNDSYRAADTWRMGRHVYESVVPWWDAVAAGQLPDDDVPPPARSCSPRSPPTCR